MGYKMNGWSGYQSSPLSKEVEKTIAGQDLEHVSGNKYKDVDSGKVYIDTAGVVTMGKEQLVVDNDFIIDNGNIIGIQEETQEESPNKIYDDSGKRRKNYKY